MKRIELCLEETEGQQLACSHCAQPLLALHEPSSFLTTATHQHYFLLHPQQQSIHSSSNCPFVINQDSVYVEIRECFFLMQMARVECSGCQLPIGLCILQGSEQHQLLPGTILLDPHALQSRPRELMGELITQLLSEIDQEDEQPHPHQNPPEQHMTYTDLVQESLSNITFYADVVDHLRERVEGHLALRKFAKAKKSMRKGRETEEG